MQIRTITVNAAGNAIGNALGIGNLTAEGTIQGKIQQAASVDNAFGPHCRVTISKEGRRLSDQQTEKKEQPGQSAQSARMERELFRRQEEAEQNKHSAEGYREQLEKIEKAMESLNHTYKAEADTDIIEKEQEVLRAMREQKQTQMEENQKRAREAQQMAMQSAKYQEEIDGNNRDILTLLKSLEEAEKAEEEQECGEVSTDSGSGASGTEHSMGNTIRNSAAQFMTSSLERELGVGEMLDGLIDGGHQLVDEAASITRNVIKESRDIRAALDDEAFTDDERAELMESFQERAGAACLDAKLSRTHGLHILQTARDYKIQRIADDPNRGMQGAKESMMLSAADAVIGEAVQGRLGEASQELKDQVEELIDERNDVDRIHQDNKEELEKKDEKDEPVRASEDPSPEAGRGQ